MQIETTVLEPTAQAPDQLPEEAKAFVAGTASGPIRHKSVTFELPDGREIELAPPPMPVDLLMPMLLQGDPENVNLAAVGLQSTIIEALLYVRKLDKKDVTPIAGRDQLNLLAYQLGDVGVKSVRAMYNEYFPGITSDTLKVIKKNL